MTGSPLVCLKASSIWWSSDARQLVCRSMGAIPPTLWSASKPCFSAAIPRNATVPSSTMDADFLGICSYLENTWFKLRQLRMCTVPTGKKNIWIHAVRKSMHRGDDYPSNTHTKKNGPAWPQDSLSGTNLWLGVETAHGAVTCLCLDQNDRNQISYIGLLGGGKQDLIHFLDAPVAAWCFW